MARPPLRHRLQAAFWELSPPLLRWLRKVKTHASLLRHRVRHRIDASVGTRVVSTLDVEPVDAIRHPAIELIGAGDPLGSHQTEVSLAGPGLGAAPFFGHREGLDRLPPAHLEAMLMAAAAEDLDWVVAGWAAPAHGRNGPSGRVGREGELPAAAHLLLRRPSSGRGRRRAVIGRAVPHITSETRCEGLVPIDDHPAAGPYRLRPDAAHDPVARHRCRPIDRLLAELPVIEGPPTVLFLLPFLAVGGAERLLFDLADGLRGRARVLIVTTDPHLDALGQTVDRARELTPHVYTLGDWLARPTLPSALRHLIRRWRVRTLVSWNGTVLFHDEAPALRRAFPDLRIVNQLFNHAGGWIEHLSPSLIRAIDAQIAINTPIARGLVEQRGVPSARVATIHHAVGFPEPRDEQRRARLRRELGVADDTVVIGSFIRMHPQKRPLDIVRLARRMTGDRVHFLLVGGGPLDAEVDADLERDPPANLTRRPLQADATPLYDALDLCLITSEFEGLPVFLLDGLARGIPCVATAVGDIPLLLEDGGGRTVERTGDLDALATAVRSLLDPERRRIEGEHGCTAVESRFGLDRYIAEYEAVLFPRDSDQESSSS